MRKSSHIVFSSRWSRVKQAMEDIDWQNTAGSGANALYYDTNSGQSHLATATFNGKWM